MRSSTSTPSALVPPEVFCLEKNFEEVAEFIQRMKDTSHGKVRRRRRRKRIPFSHRANMTHIDFVGIKEITTSAALLLASEFDRVRRLTNQQFITVDFEKWAPEVRRKLDEIGFLELLEINQSASGPEAETSSTPTVSILKFSTGLRVDRQRKRSVSNLIDQLAEIASGIEKNERLFLGDGLKEAMANVAHHAYPRDHKYTYLPDYDRWWMTGAVDTGKGLVKVVFCDQGITIPVSVPRTSIREQVLEYVTIFFGTRMMHLADDAQIIEAATRGGRSSTGEEHRGLGLPQLCDIVDEAQDGFLRILSRKGEFIYNKGGKTTRKNHLSSIGGTLIEWELKFSR